MNPLQGMLPKHRKSGSMPDSVFGNEDSPVRDITVSRSHSDGSRKRMEAGMEGNLVAMEIKDSSLQGSTEELRVMAQCLGGEKISY